MVESDKKIEVDTDKALKIVVELSVSKIREKTILTIDFHQKAHMQSKLIKNGKETEIPLSIIVKLSHLHMFVCIRK